MRTPERWLAILGVLVAALVAPSAARAQSDSVAAQSMFKEARALLEEGRTEQACALFAKSEALEANVGTLLNLGLCHEKRGKLASGWGAYNEAVRLAIKRSDPRLESARSEAARLEPRLARLTIEVDAETSSSQGFSITRNGALVRLAVLNVPTPVDAGEQEVIVRARGRRPWSYKRFIADGESIVVHVPALETQVAAPSQVGAAGKVGVGLAVGGVAAIATGLALGAIAIGKWSSVTDQCPESAGVALCANDRIRAERQQDADSAQTFATVSTVSVGVGLVALAAGIVLHLTSRDDARSAQRLGVLSF